MTVDVIVVLWVLILIMMVNAKNVNQDVSSVIRWDIVITATTLMTGY